MSDLKRILRSTVIYLFGNVSTKLISFLLIPIYTNYISPSNYGKYDIDANYATLISSVLFLDVWSGIMRFMFDKHDKKGKQRVISSGLLVFLGSVLIYTFVFFTIKSFLNIQFPIWVYLYGLFICIQNLYGYTTRALGYNIIYAVTGFLSTLINALLNIILIVYFNWGYESLYISYIIGILVQCIILEFKINLIPSTFKVKPDFKISKEIFFFSLPLCINSVCYWLLTSYNKVVVFNQLDAAQNGYYAIAMKFSLALNLVASCFSLAWQELAFSKTDESSETFSFYSKATNIYFKLLFCGACALITFVSIIFPYFVDNSYSKAKYIIPIYVTATIFNIFSTFLGNILSAYKKNNVIFISTLLACIVNVFFVNLLIGKIGLQAATISMMIGYVVNCIVRGILLHKYCQLQFDFKQLIYMMPIIGFVIFTYIYGNIGTNIFVLLCTFIMSIFIFKDYIRIFIENILQNKLMVNKSKK